MADRGITQHRTTNVTRRRFRQASARSRTQVIETIRRLRDQDGLHGEDLANALYRRGIRPEQIDPFIQRWVGLLGPWVDVDGRPLYSHTTAVAQMLGIADPVLPGDPAKPSLPAERLQDCGPSDPSRLRAHFGDPNEFHSVRTAPEVPPSSTPTPATCPLRNTTLLVPEIDQKGTSPTLEKRPRHGRLQDITEPHLLPALTHPDGSLNQDGMMRLFRACGRIVNERIGWIRTAYPLYADRGLLDRHDLRQEAFLALLTARQSFHGIPKHPGAHGVRFSTHYHNVLTRHFLNLVKRAPVDPKQEWPFDCDDDGAPIMPSQQAENPHTRIPEWLYLLDVMARIPHSGLTVAHVAGFRDVELGPKERIKKQRQRATSRLRETFTNDEN